MKELNYLIETIDVLQIKGNTNLHISSICMNSKEASKGNLFVAIKGTNTDGHIYIDKAIENGAIAIVCSELPKTLKNNTTYILTKDTNEALGQISSAFYDFPSKKIKLIGITGTNGKTSTTTILYHTLKELGYKSGLISTIANYVNDNKYLSTHTTPDPIIINKLLNQMVTEGCTYCFMEVSSHAINQKRIAGLYFSAGVFTNLTHDHLDYHKDFKSYRDTKKLFFDNLSETSFALSNYDDPNGVVMLQNTKAKKSFFSLKKPSEIKGTVLENSIDGLHMKIGRQEIHFQLFGKFSAYNLLAVYGVASKLDIDEIELFKAMSKTKNVEGRFEFIKNKKNIFAIVDYAHTPDAIENVLKTIDEIRTRNERLYVVLGAGGNRDKTKRPIMTSIAARFADRIILTSDNPRKESPTDIINDMKKGLDTYHLTKTLTIIEREEAIKTACMMAENADIILIAGKGHEKYQEINGVKHPFDDKEVLIKYLNQ